jgi:hypothetical protein
MIESSLDYNTRRDKLLIEIKSVSYSKELRVMLQNIDEMVRELSRAEVHARRNNKPISELQELKRVNDAINFLEKWILMGALIGN